jgi:hypothetical protein
MQATTELKPTITHDEITKAAWLIWESEGCQLGRDHQYWYRAKQQVLAMKQQEHSRLNDLGAHDVCY